RPASRAAVPQSMMTSGHSRLAGVIGWPVAHSRSPRLHSFWLEQYGIDGAYLPLPVRPGELEVALQGLQAVGFAGANVTLPHKEAALRLCHSLDPAAEAIGAVNTLAFTGGRILGSNSDAAGFIGHLRQASPGWNPSLPALV